MNEKEPCHMVVEKTCCGTCIHYRQHYILKEHAQPVPLWYGHCMYPRLKDRAPDQVCPHHVPADPPPELPEDDLIYPPKPAHFSP